MSTDRPPVDITVLTPVLNEERHLPYVVSRMQSQTFEGTIEFLFVDGGSTDRSRDLLTECAATDPRFRLLDNPARRTPQALNIGLAAARGEFTARMDAHTHYPVDYLQRGVDRLRRGDVVSVSGPQLAVGQGRWSRRVALALNTPLGVGGASFRRRADGEIEVDSGFTGMWRTDVLRRHGGWDERWLNDQDTELAARLRADGGRIVCLPQMAASYVPRDDLPSLAKQYWRYGAYRVKTSHRHPSTLRRSQLLPPGLALVSVAALVAPHRVRTAARAGLGAYAAALSTTSARASRGAPLRDAAALPAVYGVMHLAYGAGFLSSCLADGVPSRALGALLKRKRIAQRPGADG
jgi:succinoglycan biosynthesis protein ExoA